MGREREREGGRKGGEGEREREGGRKGGEGGREMDTGNRCKGHTLNRPSDPPQ